MGEKFENPCGIVEVLTDYFLVEQVGDFLDAVHYLVVLRRLLRNPNKKRISV